MRTPVELTLSLRSYEQVVCLTDPSIDRDQYPAHWQVPRSMKEAAIDRWTVVLVDRIDISPRVLATISAREPRLIAFAVANVEHEKSIRRLLSGCFPWHWNDDCIWTLATDFARLIVTDARGPVYDRSTIMDMRPEAVA